MDNMPHAASRYINICCNNPLFGRRPLKNILFSKLKFKYTQKNPPVSIILVDFL
jgi:hypothetical protein